MNAVATSSTSSCRIAVDSHGTLLNKSELEFENQAVLNPACILVDGVVHMYYRAVRQGNYSTIGYCQLKDNQVIFRSEQPILFPEHDYESHGLEDPRLVACEGVYYLIYTAFDGKNARIAYATSTDLQHFEKQGVISAPFLYHDVAERHKDRGTSSIYSFFHRYFAPETEHQDLLLYDKDAFIFPRKINGKYVLVHRILPEIQLICFERFEDLTPEYWKQNLEELEHHTILQPKYWFESRHVGGGVPPIETEQGWLFIYHAVEMREGERIYHAAAALLDLEDPTKVLARLSYPLFSPESAWEVEGDVNNVVFPSGAVVDGDQLWIYYGGADSQIGVRSLSITALLDELQHHPEEEEVVENAFAGQLELLNSI